MSRAIVEAPTIAPKESLTPEIVNQTSITVPSLRPTGLVLLDPVAGLNLRENSRHVASQRLGHEHVDGLADRLRRRISVDPHCGRVPARDRPIERVADDRVVRRPTIAAI